MGKSIAIVYHSGYGHTKKQAEAVHKGVSQVEGVTAMLYAVDSLSDDVWQSLNKADAIIFGAPLTWARRARLLKTLWI